MIVREIIADSSPGTLDGENILDAAVVVLRERCQVKVYHNGKASIVTPKAVERFIDDCRVAGGRP